MKVFVCQGCGSHEFREENGYRICEHCGTKHIITAEDKGVPQSTIDLQNDVNRLLEKCKEEPERAKKFAQRILEIDPNNAEAKAILYRTEYKSQPKSGCYIATAVYGSYDCPEVWTLRRYRDVSLAATRRGRLFIRLYYATSPTLVKWFGDNAWFRRIWKGQLDRKVKKLQSKGFESTPYTDRKW